MSKEIRLIGLSLGLLIIDLITKYLFYNREIGQSLSFLEPVFNKGISRGIDFPLFLVITISIVALGMFVWMYKQKVSWLVIAMLLSGTVGNLVDRIVFAGVRDFIVVGNFPVFNIADILLSVGVGLFLLKEILGLQNQTKKLEKK